MPGTIVTEEIELIPSDKGPDGGGFSGDGGDGGDGGDSSGATRVPQRAYITGMFIAPGSRCKSRAFCGSTL
jgi:hypothetical protein